VGEAKVTGYVVCHGHMDIEWYMPLRSFRFWTVEALDELRAIARERPEFATYVLDGQTCVLDIYLQARPEARGEMAELVRRGVLSVGPFYSQFDEWLTSPESMVRNCLYGNRSARAWGAVMKAGYLPDNFGHPLQLPQILNQFGLDSLLFMRGMPEIPGGHPDELMYTGLDGSRLFVSHFRDTYGGAFNVFGRADVLPLQPRDMPYHDEYFTYEQYRELADHVDPSKVARDLIASVGRIKDRYPSGVVPLIAGYDHFPPQARLGEVVALANSMQDGIRFVMGNAEGYVRAAQARMKKPLEYREELIGSFYQYVLLGALSTRSYLKRANFGSEALMERYAEPLDALASLLDGWQETRPQMDEAWKLLMTNSAHDSIHGSSMDEVHVEMEGRFAAASQIATGLAHAAIKHVGARMEPWWESGDAGVLTFTPADAGAPQAGQAWLPIGDAEACLYDRAGRALPTQVLPRDPIECNSHGKPRTTPWPDPLFRKVLFLASPAVNAVDSFMMRKCRAPFADMAAGDCFIENGRIRVEVRGALLDVLDKETGRWNRGLNLVAEDADAGDAWDYSPTSDPSETVLSNAFPFTSRLTERGPVRSTIEVTGAMSVPKRLIGDARSPERVDIPMSFSVSLEAAASRVDVRLSLENTAKDHRLRLAVPAGARTDVVRSQGAFGIITRPIERTREVQRWIQPPTQILPFREWVAVDDGATGLAVAAKGMYDYSAAVNPLSREPTVFLTLLRGFEYMSRINTLQREGPAAQGHRTPGAQCPGTQVMEWSYIPYRAAAETAAPFLPQAQAFLYPMMTHMARAKRAAAATAAPAPLQPFRLLDGAVRFSCFKRAFDGGAWVLRCYEDQGRSVTARLRLDGFRSARLSDMNEEPGQALALGPDGTLELPVGPYKVVTLLLET
jgi:mannosylglycerate hydrolase